MFGVAFADTGAAGAATGLGGMMGSFQQIIPLVLMFAIFYFLLIRPQQKKAKEHKALLESIKKGDSIITAGGVYGKVASVEDGIVGLEIANGVVIKIVKSYIATINNK
jgi:preprotein translocase subunit YajC